MAGRAYSYAVARREWGSGSIYPIPGGWRVSISLGTDPFGKRRRKEWQYRQKARAEAKLRDVQRRLDRGEPVEESRMTLGAYVPEWLAGVENTVRPATYQQYRSLAEVHLTELEPYRLSKLGAADIRDLLAARLKEGYATRTVRGILDVLRMLLRQAQSDGLVERNVAELVKPPKQETAEPRRFTADQARRFLDVAAQDPLGGLYAVALGTGLRRGELLGLTHKDVDLQAGTVVVRRGKTVAAARVVPLPAFAQAALRASLVHTDDDHLARQVGEGDGDVRLARRPAGSDGRRVRPSGRVGPIWPVSPSWVTHHFADLCRQAGVPVLTFHSTRHTAASLMLEQGVDPYTIQAILGHSKATMSGYYSRSSDELRRDAVEKLGRAIG